MKNSSKMRILQHEAAAKRLLFHRLFGNRIQVTMAIRNRIFSKYDIYINLMCCLSLKSDRCHKSHSHGIHLLSVHCSI